MSKSLPDLIKHVAQPGSGMRIFNYFSRSSSVCNESSARLSEDMVKGHGETQHASDIDFTQAAFLGQVCE